MIETDNMHFLKRYMTYLRDNPHRYWFKRRLWGWGWTPVRLQGWLVVAGYVGLLFGTSLFMRREDMAQKNVLVYFSFAAVLTIALIVICYRTGEKPRWTWGPPKK